MVHPTDVYLKARELVGTPYFFQGRNKDPGIDCIGVPIWVASQLGLGNLNRLDYTRVPDGTMQQKIADVCPEWFLTPGALVVLKIEAFPHHCGIVSRYMDGLGLIHAWDIAMVVAEHRLTQDWRDRIVGCYKLPGVNTLLVMDKNTIPYRTW